MSAAGSEHPFFDFVTWGVCGMIIVATVYTGNTLTLIALSRNSLTPTAVLIMALSVSDIVLLTGVAVTGFVPRICNYTLTCDDIWIVWPHVRYLYLVVPAAHLCSIWITVLIAFNRYWAVCRPHESALVWTKQRTLMYVACVVVGSILFNVPRIFAFRIVPTPANSFYATALSATNYNETIQLYEGFSTLSTEQNKTLCCFNSDESALPYSSSSVKLMREETRYHEEKTAMGGSRVYAVVYQAILAGTCLTLLPLCILAVTSIVVIRALYVLDNKTKQKFIFPRSGYRKGTTTKEVTVVLVTVVLVAFVCQTPLGCFHLLRDAFGYEPKGMLAYLNTISKLLVNLNASINFIVYCVLSPRFRRLLLCPSTSSDQGAMIDWDKSPSSNPKTPTTSTRTIRSDNYVSLVSSNTRITIV